MRDLIDRQAALDVLCDACGNCACPKGKIPRCSYYEKMQAIPTVSPWRRVEEKPKEGTWCVIAKHSYLQPHNLFYDIAHYLHGTFSVYDSGVGDWFDGKPLYWMPIEPPKGTERNEA